MKKNEKDVGLNIKDKATVIWNIANSLFGYFKPHEYGTVILPMVVIKRFHDCLLPTREDVLKKWQEVKTFEKNDSFLTTASGYQFYNTSEYTFKSLLADADNIESNFKNYINGFSKNVLDILERFNFDEILERVVESGSLYQIIKEFASDKGYLGADKISAVDCGYIFEELVRMFSESYGENAGAHFTSRDIIYTMTDLLLANENLSNLTNITVYDQTMGTSQMLTCMEERIHDLNPNVDVMCFGQEINPQTFAIAKADMLIRGGNPDNMKFGDTLSEDKFNGYTFKYLISNPPFGIDWKKEKKKVEAEAKKGDAGRFPCGLPKISDGQQLFMLNGISKMADDGRMAIIQNGSPLFTGTAGSGPSNIRKYIIENDWLDAIVQLSTNQFMNTGITTYIWIIDKNKPIKRVDKIQLIDASHCFEQRRKPIGDKRNDITDICKDLIVKAYLDFKNDEVYKDDDKTIYCESKIFDRDDFGYREVLINRPLRDRLGNVVTKDGKPIVDSSISFNENIPLKEDINEYFNREVKPFLSDAWVEKKKMKIGYEIPFTRYFYKYQQPKDSDELLKEFMEFEENIDKQVKELLGL